MTRLLLGIIVGATILFFSCKKETIAPPSSGIPNTTFDVTDYPHHIGDTCFYKVTRITTVDYTNGSPSNVYNYVSNFYSTIIADSILPNGTIGKIWFQNSCSVLAGYKQVVYFDSTLACNVFIPIGSVPDVYKLMIKMPLHQNTTWVNTLNIPTDTCKALNYEFYSIGNNGYQCINVQRTFYDFIVGSSNLFEYKISNYGFVKNYHMEFNVLGTFSTVNETEITLTRAHLL